MNNPIQRVCFLLFVLFIYADFSFAQKTITSEPNSKTAKEQFELMNYKDALTEYLLLIKTDSANLDYNFKLGVCYMNTNIDKSKAIPYLEFVVKQPKCDPETWYELGRAYQNQYRFVDAIKMYKKFIEVSTSKIQPFIPPDRQIEMCNQAMELMKDSIDVTFQNLGPEINSSSPEFRPYVPADESFIVYTSKRIGNMGNMPDFDGYMTSDIYVSYPVNATKWLKTKGIGANVNSNLVEETAGLSADGTELFVFVDNYKGISDIFQSSRKGKVFLKSVTVGPPINSIAYEGCATITSDKKTLYFSSEILPSKGGKDIWMSNKLPNGTWGSPVNVGENINSKFDEDSPNLSPDGKTLYFASLGHKGMGGFDLFKSQWDEEKKSWGKAINLGYPINTPNDELSICYTASDRNAYVAALRKDGFGDLDIYKVTFNNVEPKYTILKGTLLRKETVMINQKTVNKNQDSLSLNKNIEITDNKDVKKELSFTDLNVNILITDKLKKTTYGHYTPNKHTGNFVIILPPGSYSLSITGNGVQDYSEDIKIIEKPSNTEIQKNIYITTTN